MELPKYGSDPARPAYPLEPIRHRYVSPFGGVTYELAPGEVGVRENALRENTHLVPGEDSVLVANDLDGRAGGFRRPRFGYGFFRVVALDPRLPDAYERSPHGEVVFSSFEDAGSPISRLLRRLHEGDAVVLNAVYNARRAAGAKLLGGLGRPGALDDA